MGGSAAAGMPLGSFRTNRPPRAWLPLESAPIQRTKGTGVASDKTLTDRLVESNVWQRRRAKVLADSEQRAFEALRRSDGLAPPVRARAYVLVSVAVIAVAGAAVALLVWATLSPKGFWGWVGVAIGWLVVFELAPRPYRLDEDVVMLDEESAPATTALVASLASAVGTPVPAVIAVDHDFNAHVAPLGWRGRPVLVIGLPLWSALTDHERLALLGHELGHLRGRDTVVGSITGTARLIAHRVTLLLTPLPADAYTDFADYSVDAALFSNGFFHRVVTVVLTVVTLPLRGMVHLLDRLALAHSHHREFVADLRAARVAGTTAMTDLLTRTMNVDGLRTVANAAVRRNEDPFGPLDAVRTGPRPKPADVERLHAHAAAEERRWDHTHPKDTLRLALVESRPVPAALPPLLDLAGADAELRALRPRLARQLRDDLLEGWY